MKRLVALALVVCWVLASSEATQVGGRQHVDVNDEQVVRLSWKAIHPLNRQSNSYYHFVPFKVVKAESQVVSGIMYHLRVIFVQSRCAKGVSATWKMFSKKEHVRTNSGKM